MRQITEKPLTNSFELFEIFAHKSLSGIPIPQKNGEFSGQNFGDNRIFLVRFRPKRKFSGRNSFHQKPETLAIVYDSLNRLPTPITKEKERSRKWVHRRYFSPAKTKKPVEPSPKIHNLRETKYPHVRRNRNHRRNSAKRFESSCGVASILNRSSAPSTRLISTATDLDKIGVGTSFTSRNNGFVFFGRRVPVRL